MNNVKNLYSFNLLSLCGWIEALFLVLLLFKMGFSFTDSSIWSSLLLATIVISKIMSLLSLLCILILMFRKAGKLRSYYIKN